MKQIPLTKGKVAIVDDEDFDELSKHKWHFSGKYARRAVVLPNGKQELIWMHRVIANTPDGMDTDHVNGIKLDNRRANLRSCTRSQNTHNRETRREAGAYRGVYYRAERTEKWEARIVVNYKPIVIGYFDTAREAAIAYNQAAIELVGEFAKLNDVSQGGHA